MFVKSLINKRPDGLRSVTIALVPLHAFRQVFTAQLLCATHSVLGASDTALTKAPVLLEYTYLWVKQMANKMSSK